jgi:vancomycin resistance protein YoaR
VAALLACALALASLSVAAAHWWPSAQSQTTAGTAATTQAAVVDAEAAAAEPVASPTPAAAAATPVPDVRDSRLAGLLDPAANADVTLDLTFGSVHETLHRSDLAALVVLDGDRPKLDSAALRALAGRLGDEWDQPMMNARFSFNGGDLTPIRDSQEGRTLDETAAASAIGEALTSGSASVALPGTIVAPAVSSDNPQGLGITTNLERGSTSFAGSIPEKAHNIRLAAQRLNGVVIPPGGVFSFNQEVGPTTLNAGFEWGFGIEASADGARTVPSVAGGICQVATTLFQRVFWAGFPLVERHWHLYWIPAYTSRSMVGLDATVDADSGLDLRWSNPTDSYILIQSATDDSNVYFGLYGSPHSWKVSVDQPDISNRVAADPAPLAQAEPTLPWGRILPVEAARDGFDVAITRTVTREDGQPRSLTLKSSYEPSRNVTLVGTKDKPAGADVNAVLERIAPPVRPTATVSATPSPVGTNAPAGSAAIATESVPRGTATPAAGSANGSSVAPTATSRAVATATPIRTPVPSTPTAVATATRAAATATSTPKPAASPTVRPTVGSARR